MSSRSSRDWRSSNGTRCSCSRPLRRAAPHLHRSHLAPVPAPRHCPCTATCAGLQRPGGGGGKQALHLTGADAVAELDDLKARIARDRDLELTLSWRLERKGTKL